MYEINTKHHTMTVGTTFSTKTPRTYLEEALLNMFLNHSVCFKSDLYLLHVQKTDIHWVTLERLEFRFFQKVTISVYMSSYMSSHFVHVTLFVSCGRNSRIPRMKPRWYGALATSDYAKGLSYRIAYRRIAK